MLLICSLPKLISTAVVSPQWTNASNGIINESLSLTRSLISLFDTTDVLSGSNGTQAAQLDLERGGVSTSKGRGGVSTFKGKSARSHVGSLYRPFTYHDTLAVIVHAPLSSLDARLAIFIRGLYQAYTRLTSDNTTNADSSEVEFVQSFITVQVHISISSFTLRGLHCVPSHPSPLQ